MLAAPTGHALPEMGGEDDVVSPDRGDEVAKLVLDDGGRGRHVAPVEVLGPFRHPAVAAGEKPTPPRHRQVVPRACGRNDSDSIKTADLQATSNKPRRSLSPSSHNEAGK